MPVTDTTENTNKAKYILYYSTTFGGTYTRSYRTIIQSFRTQMKGLGAGSATYLPQTQLNETLATENLQPNMFIKILDGTVYWADTYTSVGDEVFIGTIESVTTDIFQNSSDRQGSIIFNEIGHFLATQPIRWATTPQVFNPVLENSCYGNLDPDADPVDFEDDPDDMVKADTTTGKFANSGSSNLLGNSRVWSLEQMLRYMSVAFSFDIKFPWEIDQAIIQEQADRDIANINSSTLPTATKNQLIADVTNNANNEKSSTEANYGYFKDTLDIRSFAHYDGQSVPQMLQELITEPFSYFVSYISTAAPTYNIINKSPVIIQDICPASKMLVKKIDNDKITNLNITEDADVYDSVTYRGNNILFCGSVSPWVANSADSLLRDWEIDDELKYIQGVDSGAAATELSVAQSYRMDEQEDVYTKLKFNYYDQPCYFRLPKALADNGVYTQAAFFPAAGDAAYTMVPFLPAVDFVKYENGSEYIRTTPVIDNTLGSHKTPPKLQFKWAEKLPFEGEKSKKLKEPFMICTFATTDSDPSIANSILFQNVSEEGAAFKVQLEWLRDGIRVKANPPEALGYSGDELYAVDLTNPMQAKQNWLPVHVSSRNPSTSTNYCSSWEASVFTVAAYSAQKLEWTVRNPNTPNNIKTKIIEDETLECHVIHAGTIKKLKMGPYEVAAAGTNRNNRTNGFERFQKDTFIRNDFKKLNTLCHQTAQWLFQPKRAIRLEEHLMLHQTGSWKVGQMISNIIDDSVKHNIFTAVESVEYDAMVNRVRISTSVPQMPEFKRLRQQPISSANIAPVSDTKSPTIQQASKIIKLPSQPVTGYTSGGGGTGSGSAVSSNLYYVVGGNTLPYLGVSGIKHISTLITTAAEGYSNGVPATLPDGIGWIRSIDTNTYHLAFNDNTSYISYDITSQPVYAMKTGVISGGSGEDTWSYDKFTICGAI